MYSFLNIRERVSNKFGGLVGLLRRMRSVPVYNLIL